MHLSSSSSSSHPLPTKSLSTREVTRRHASDMYKSVENYARCDDIIHTAFYGPPGSGKLALARELIAIHTNTDPTPHTRVCHYYKVKDREFPFFKSSVHFEMDVHDFPPSQPGCLMDLLQELSRTLNVSRNSYKLIVLRNAEKLTRTVQHQLRRMMELFYTTCRVILLTRSLDCIDHTIQSRMVCIRVPLATDDDDDDSSAGSSASSRLDHIRPGNTAVTAWLAELIIHPLDATATATATATDAPDAVLSVLSRVVQQLATVVTRKKFGIVAFRKLIRLISFTQLPEIEIVHQVYLKVVTRFASDVKLQVELLSLLNYYMYMHEVGSRKEFHLEMAACAMYAAVHERAIFEQLLQTSRTDFV
jgi:DNA polymerase III delta prime subunit